MRFLGRILLFALLAPLGIPAFGQQFDSFPQAAQTAKTSSYLGVGVTDVDSERIRSLNLENESGVQIVRLSEGSPADKAGLKPGDILLSYNGETILGGRQLGRLVSETPIGRHVKIRYWRDGTVHTGVLTTEAAPDALTELQNRMSELADGARFPMPTDVPTPILVWHNRALGMGVEPLDSQLADYFGVKDGVLVRFVDKGSPADTAGIRSGDVLTAVGTQQVSNPHEVSSCIRSQPASKQVSISLVRNHKPLKLTVTPASYPQ